MEIKPQVYDCFMFGGEYDLLEIRFNILDKFVDHFVICEGAETFSGMIKPLYWAERDLDRFGKWEHKVIYIVVHGYSDPDILDLLNDRTYVDTPSFMRAFYQKESIKSGLVDARDEDIIIYGDADEIINPEIISQVDDKTHKLRQIAYSYYLNNRSPEDWRGTIITKYKNVKNACLNDLRANPVEDDILEDGGWHFTNIGGLSAVLHKIESYDHQEVNIPWVRNGMADRMLANQDFLGRGFQFWEDESQLPKYLLDNKSKYLHLFK